MDSVSGEDLSWTDYFDQHYCDFDFAFRCVVYDPCDRPGHFPHSDMWLNAKQQRVQDTILDWLATIAWDWDQVAIDSADALHRTMFINEFVTFEVSPLAFADYQAANLAYTCKSSGKKFLAFRCLVWVSGSGGGGAGRVVWGYGYHVVVHRRPATA